MSSARFERNENGKINISTTQLQAINDRLNNCEPQEILKWSVEMLPGLFQTTAFGLSGLVICDMLSKLELAEAQQVEHIFIDTLHHFEETKTLAETVALRYGLRLHVYKPRACETAQDFEKKFGPSLWARIPSKYDYYAKVEPGLRAYSELGVCAVLTGRRRCQGGERSQLDVLQVDEDGLIKVNPLACWSFEQVQDYAKKNKVPTNPLLEKGFRSIGDWHSTEAVREGEEERAGRWRGTAKTECGLHCIETFQEFRKAGESRNTNIMS